MRTTSFLRSLSSRLTTTTRRSSSRVVAPLPEQTRFSDEITGELDALRSSECEFTSASWLVDVLDATIVTQKVAQEYVIKNANNIILSKIDNEMIDTYLESNVELLDACNGLVEKIDMVHKYVDSLQTSMRLLAIDNVRGQEIFKECGELEAQCAALDKCGPKLCRLMGKKDMHVNHGEDNQDLKLHEVLSGSKEVATMSCHLLQRALSFKSRQGHMKIRSKLPTTWSSSLNALQEILNEEAENRKKRSAPWMMNELEKMVMDARILHDQVKCSKGSVSIDNLRRSCKALEEGVKPLEERVRELYKHLISIRMDLLGILSRS